MGGEKIKVIETDQQGYREEKHGKKKRKLKNSIGRETSNIRI